MASLDQLMSPVPTSGIILDILKGLFQMGQCLLQPLVVSGDFPGLVNPKDEDVLHI